MARMARAARHRATIYCRTVVEMCAQIEKERLIQKTKHVEKGKIEKYDESEDVLLDFGKWKLSVAECFVLLWLDEHGRMAERQSNGFLRTLAVCASLVDLVLLGFGDRWISDRLELRRLSVTDKGRTHHLPAHVAWLEPLLAHIRESPDATLTSVAHHCQCYTRVWSWLNDGAKDLRPHTNAPTDPITDSLIAKGIVRREPAWNGVRFPAEDPACKAAVVAHLPPLQPVISQLVFSQQCCGAARARLRTRAPRARRPAPRTCARLLPCSKQSP